MADNTLQQAIQIRLTLERGDALDMTDAELVEQLVVHRRMARGAAVTRVKEFRAEKEFHNGK